MKFRWDRKYLYWGTTAFCVIACSLIFFWTVTQWDAVRRIVGTILDILSPIIIGIVIAYILTPALTFFEKRLYLKLGHKIFPNSRRSAIIFGRIASIVTVIAVLLIVIATLLVLALPQIYFSIQKLVLNMENYYNTAVKWLEGLFENDAETGTLLANILAGATQYFTNWVQSGLLPQIEGILASISSGVITAIMAIADFVVGIMVSCYVLYRKEEFAARLKKLAYSVLSEKATRSLISGVNHIHRTFGRFIVGKLIDALIIGILCAAFMVITNLPYATLISVIIGVTNIIPFFGPYIGAIPSGFLILLESPVQCVIFIAFIFVLQTFDGNVLEPKIIGNSTGLSGFWVVFSILAFGGLFGFIGMLCGVPIFAVIYTGLGSWSRNRLKKKNMPTETSAYETSGPISPLEPIPAEDKREEDLPKSEAAPPGTV